MTYCVLNNSWWAGQTWLFYDNLLHLELHGRHSTYSYSLGLWTERYHSWNHADLRGLHVLVLYVPLGDENSWKWRRLYWYAEEVVWKERLYYRNGLFYHQLLRSNHSLLPAPCSGPVPSHLVFHLPGRRWGTSHHSRHRLVVVQLHVHVHNNLRCGLRHGLTEEHLDIQKD